MRSSSGWGGEFWRQRDIKSPRPAALRIKSGACCPSHEEEGKRCLNAKQQKLWRYRPGRGLPEIIAVQMGTFAFQPVTFAGNTLPEQHIYKPMEFGAVMHMPDMRHFVRNRGTAHSIGHHDQPPAIADVAIMRAAAPAAFGVSHRDPGYPQACIRSNRERFFGQKRQCLCFQKPRHTPPDIVAWTAKQQHIAQDVRLSGQRGIPRNPHHAPAIRYARARLNLHYSRASRAHAQGHPPGVIRCPGNRFGLWIAWRQSQAETMAIAFLAQPQSRGAGVMDNVDVRCTGISFDREHHGFTDPGGWALAAELGKFIQAG